MKMENIPIGQLVSEDFRRAGLFKQAGLDFCCEGHKTLTESCEENDLDMKDLVRQLKELEQSHISRAVNYASWSPDFLADYITNTHHSYVRNTLPDLLFYTKKISGVHGHNHPELSEIADLITQIHDELIRHMQAEEDVLFPAIKSSMQTPTEESRQLIKGEIERMHSEHEFAGSTMDYIRQLTHQYTVPADACQTYEVALQLLREFEDDLHIHVHLENNILFRKALEL